MNNTLTAVPGIRVGHVTDLENMTGCTVILCPKDTLGGVDVRGGAPGTRETELLTPMHRVQTVNGIVLSGGSAYGLSAADGVMRYLEEIGEGYVTNTGYIVPIVPAAIVFDLALGNHQVRPSSSTGYQAAAAASDMPVEMGSVGAGTGCRVGAMLGNEFASKGGVGSASMDLGGGLIVAALCVVNAVGDVVEEDGTILAGLRQPPDGTSFASMLNMMKIMMTNPPPSGSPILAGGDRENTVLGVVATNAVLTKEETNKVAQMAHDGLARAVRPAHTMYDGDTMFALSTGQVKTDVNLVGAFGAEIMAQAIRNAVKAAKGLGGVRGWGE